MNPRTIQESKAKREIPKACACHPKETVGSGEPCEICQKNIEEHIPFGYCEKSLRQADWLAHRFNAIEKLKEKRGKEFEGMMGSPGNSMPERKTKR